MKTYSKEMECPMCGAKHMLTFHEYDALYLDGLPAISVKELSAAHVLCTECGFLYTCPPPVDIDVWSVFKSDKYQQILKDPHNDEIETKLKLYNVLYGNKSLPLYLSHYYAEIGNREKEINSLHEAIRMIIDQEDDNTYETGQLPLQHFHMPYKFAITPEARLVDMYRRLGDFDAAQAQINKLRSAHYLSKPYALLMYCKEEEKLIRAKNTQTR